jgi:hypothetical protein
MNIPAKDFKIKVGQYIIDVVYRNNTKLEGKENYGSFELKDLRIIISKKWNKNKQQLENTFLHESLHAIWEIFGVKDVGGTAGDAEAEEIFVERLTAGLQSFIVDNPKLFK